ncbi:MAG: winged helix-turn-helix domain-containing protein, partial [Pseudomonadota bacterium]
MTEHAFRLGDWLVTPARHALERDGEVIRLKPKAMAVLEQLAGAAGDVVPRDELFAAVWPGCAVTDDTLTQCVVELRRALGDSARAPRFIETVPRRGFRLLADVQVTEAAVARHVVRRRWPVLAALVALAAVALTTLATMPRSAAPSAQSLAVLPFADLSPSEDYGFFADGLTEELINRLSMLDGLQVTGRTSAFQFRGGVDDLGDVRERLGVTWVLDGSVRRDRGRLRVSAQLIDTATGYPAWLETYEENSTGIFEIQDGIAEAVAGALSVRLGVGHLGREPGGTRNLDAYEAHIQGNALYAEFTAEAMRQAAA